MRILILEDDQERIEWFKQALQGNELFITNDVETAKSLFDDTIDTIFLDHDLDQKVYVPSSEPNTGGQFARWLREYGYVNPNVPIYIHSMNGPGAIYMKMWLPQAIIMPYPMLRHRLEEGRK